MSTFTGTAGNNTINAVAFPGTNNGGNNAASNGSGNGVIGGTLADLQDGIGDTFNMGDGDDTVIAGDAADTINGGNGNDGLGGMNGADAINGGEGTDEVRYDREVGAVGVTVNLVTGTATDRYGATDTLSSIESIRGTSSVDTFTGGNAANGVGTHGLIIGFESFRGLAGADIINGGQGYDEARYDADFSNGGFSGINANLTTGLITDGFGTVDTTTSIEGVRGTRYSDVFVGSSEDDTFVGLAGADSFSGGDGFDGVNYSNDAGISAALTIGGPNIFGTAGITVNLQTGTATDGYGATDTFVFTNGITTIENITGTIQVDNFTGRNSLEHSDQFRGLAGADIINGGGGYDEVRYDGDAFFLVGTGWLGGIAGVTVNLTAGTAIDGYGTVDSLTNVENVRGTYQVDNITGSAAHNAFRGLAGADIINGGDGNDAVGFTTDFLNRDAFGNFGTAGVTVNLLAGTAVDGFGTIDTLISIESASGTAQADTFIGSAENNVFSGYGGADNIDGGAGTEDEVRYDGDEYWTGSTAGVTVNLGTGIATDAGGSIDTLANLEGVRGTRFVDTLTGGSGDEFFRGLKGNDIINGGGGSDWVSYSRDYASKLESETLLAVNVTLGGAAIDSWGNTDTLTSIENVAGGLLGDTLTGDGNGNMFRGLLGADTINGGGGSDTTDYSRDKGYGDLIQVNGAGNITVNLVSDTATDGFGNTDSVVSIENAIGGAGNDDFTGVDGEANAFTGGDGNDVYRVGDYSDVVTEAAGATAGTGDRVHTSLAIYTLAANVEQLYTLGGGARNYTGNAENNIIQTDINSEFNDYIDGGAGADTMEGGRGSDTYIVDNVGDTVIGELPTVAGGYDVVIATANHSLGDNIEQLVLQGGATSGTGNNSANYLYGGNSGLSLTLNGLGGDDVLFAGLAGGNTMNGGAGVDTLLIYGGNNTANGGLDSDIYFTYSATDVLSEVGGSGIDTVYSTYSITVAEDIEQVLISGAATSITSTSVDDNNIFYGNSAAGPVTLSGGGGADVLFGGVGGDTLNGGAGVDLLFGNGGADNLAGGADTDIYYLSSGTETITETAGGGFDTAYTNVLTTTMAANLEQLILYGAAGVATGSSGDNYIYGHIASMAVALDGAGGNDYLLDSAQSGDQLVGGSGNDLLHLVSGGNDSIRFAAAGTNADTVLNFDADATGGQDIIDVSGRGFSAASIGGAITIAASGGDTLITIGADTITLIGVASANVTAADFLF